MHAHAPRLLIVGCSVLLAVPAAATREQGAGQSAAGPGATGPRVEITSYDARMVTAPPAALGLDPFYQKYADAHGVPIVASAAVRSDAVLMLRDIVAYMLAKRPDVREELVGRGGRLMIIGADEQQTDLPEYRDMKKPAKDDPRLTPREREQYDQPRGIGSQTDQEYWNRRARGLGGIRTSCGEENLLGIVNSRYYGEHICVHEFSHGIMSALRNADRRLWDEIQAAYAAAKAAGRFKGHYAENTAAEYWAEGTQWWFWSNFKWTDPNGVVLWSPDDLKAYDPTLFRILDRVYPGHHIPADIYHGRDARAEARERGGALSARGWSVVSPASASARGAGPRVPGRAGARP